MAIYEYKYEYKIHRRSNPCHCEELFYSDGAIQHGEAVTKNKIN
ncbi:MULTISPECIES: hypothetical protein [unclassified Campylobacter]|nr:MULTISPECIES: hypothetical protein [unclassified Campylobacter]MDA3062824.1 hypothetical protein [Campylobacter sp. JMF_14 EL1]MDA3073718.1 hypothetical protein [Campylobacter sp. JMF_10 EL2]